MIKKAFLVTAIFFGLYTFLVTRVRPAWGVWRHQWQDNQIRAEKYLYDPQQTQRVVVGSSLSKRINEIPGVYNLAFDGQSALDGLAIVAADQRPLASVFIEINVMDRSADSSFTAPLVNPFYSLAKRSFRSLRADKQPLGLAAERVEHLLNPVFQRLTVQAPSIVQASPDLFNKMLADQEHNYSQVPAPQVLEHNFSKLTREVNALERRGVRVIFFELPVDCHLYSSPKATTLRATFRRYFPPTKYTYVSAPDCAQYKTTDGQHLNPESATEYTHYLQAHLY